MKGFQIVHISDICTAERTLKHAGCSSWPKNSVIQKCLHLYGALDRPLFFLERLKIVHLMEAIRQYKSAAAFGKMLKWCLRGKVYCKCSNCFFLKS